MNMNKHFAAVLLVIAIILIVLFTYRQRIESFFSAPSGKTLVFFSSKRCGRCTEFQPIWNQFVYNFQDDQRVTFKQINGDMYPDALAMYNVTQYPTIIAIQQYPVPYAVKFGGFTLNNAYDNLIQFYTAFRSNSFYQG